MNKQMFALVSLLVAASMILAGCGAPATPQVIQQTVEVPVTTVVEVTAVPAATTAPEGGEIAVIVKTGNSSF